jgi:hypothetical protein
MMLPAAAISFVGGLLSARLAGGPRVRCGWTSPRRQCRTARRDWRILGRLEDRHPGAVGISRGEVGGQRVLRSARTRGQPTGNQGDRARARRHRHERNRALHPVSRPYEQSLGAIRDALERGLPATSDPDKVAQAVLRLVELDEVPTDCWSAATPPPRPAPTTRPSPNPTRAGST